MAKWYERASPTGQTGGLISACDINPEQVAPRVSRSLSIVLNLSSGRLMIRNLLDLIGIFRNRRRSPSELEALRERKLRTVIRNAYEHVPYYRALFNAARLTPEDICTVEDLKKIPVSTKDHLRAAGLKKTVADWVDVSTCIRTMTSGVTGKPFEVYRTPSEYMTTRLHITATLLTYGFRPGDRLVSLEGSQVVQVRFHHRLRFFDRELIADGLSIDDEIRQLVSLQPTMLWAFPSRLKAILQHSTIPLGDLMPLKTIITWGEAVDGPLRARLQEELSIELFSCYGANEAVLIAWECPSHEGLHVNCDHVVLEFLPDNNFRENNELDTAVVTSLDALAMPFIRYQLGDLCARIEKTCSCGRSLPLIDHPVGREADMVRLPSGKMLPAVRLAYILRVLPGIFQWQVVQETPRDLIVKLVIEGQIAEDMDSHIRSRFAEYLKEPVNVDIQIVDSLEDEARKFRTFISKVPPLS